MNPITHLLVGWTLAEEAGLDGRDRELVAWAGVVPDLDGLGLIPDVVNKVLGRPETFFYGDYHHVLGHGLPAAVLATALGAALATESSGLTGPGNALRASTSRWRTAGLVLVAFHLHLLADLVGSRGPSPDDLWPIAYLAPVSSKLTFVWSGQWPVNDFRNIGFTLALLGLVFVRAVRRGASPVGLFSRRADAVFVETLRHRFGHRAADALQAAK